MQLGSSGERRYPRGSTGLGASLHFAGSSLFTPMAGLTSATPQPTAITVHQHSRMLEVGFSSGDCFRIPFELLRVYSPSAEVQGHGPGQEVLQVGKRDVLLLELDPVGHYAVQPRFSDGHASGIYSWDYLYFLGSRQAELWRDYEARLAAAGAGRDATGQSAGSLPDLGAPARSGSESPAKARHE